MLVLARTRCEAEGVSMRFLLILGGLFLFAGCNEDVSAGGSDSTCRVGSTKVCDCPNGDMGKAECGPDGRFSACEPCPPSGGMPMAGGTVESNSAPTIGGVSVSPNPARETNLLTCTVSDVTDADSDEITLSYRWLVNDRAVDSSNETLDTAFFGRGDRVVCEVQASDETAQSEPVRSEAITISNTAPSIGAVTIEPEIAQMGATLRCTYSDFSDVDGDADASTFEWILDDNVIATTQELETDGVSGTTYTCRVTPRDDADAGESKSAEITIGNTAPTVANARIDPPMPRATDSLTCAHDAPSDVDPESELTVSYRWLVNGEEVLDAVMQTLESGAYSAGDEVTCTVVANDGTAESEPAVSMPVTILNTPPTVAAATLAPDEATESDVLACTPGAVDDIDMGQMVTLEYTWFVNEQVIMHDGNTVDGTHFDRGDSVACAITPTDGIDRGVPAPSNSVMIGNSTPSVANVTILPVPARAGVELRCEYAFADADGDDDASSVVWRINDLESGFEPVLNARIDRETLLRAPLRPMTGVLWACL